MPCTKYPSFPRFSIAQAQTGNESPNPLSWYSPYDDKVQFLTVPQRVRDTSKTSIHKWNAVKSASLHKSAAF